jgi:hypothetical protein
MHKATKFIPVDFPHVMMSAQLDARAAFAGQDAGMHSSRRLHRRIVIIG